MPYKRIGKFVWLILWPIIYMLFAAATLPIWLIAGIVVMAYDGLAKVWKSTAEKSEDVG